MENQELAKRQNAWGNFGVKMYQTESELSAKFSAASIELATAPSKELIKTNEETLKKVKQALKDLQEDRKAITNKLDDVKARLMIPEKDLTELVKGYEAAVISVKKEIEANNAAKNAKSNEEKDLAEKVKLSWVNYIAAVDQVIIDTAYKVYLELLETKVEPKNYDETVKRYTNFSIPEYKPFFQALGYNQQFLTDGEKAIIYTANKSELKDVTARFLEVMAEKKAGYKSELANVEQAKIIMATQKAEADKAAKAKIEAQQLELKLASSMALDAEPKSDVKELRKVYDIDMPNDYQSALKLYAAFSANIKEVEPLLNVKKWLSLTPESIGKALAKLKSKDNSLNFEGITFVEVSKL